MFTGEATGSKLGIIAGASHPVQSCPRYSTGASGQSRSPVGPILLVHQILLQMPEAASWFLIPPMLRCPPIIPASSPEVGGRAAESAGCHAVSIHEESSNCLPFQLPGEDSAARTGRKPDRGLIGATPRVRPGNHVLPCDEREYGRPAGAGQRSSLPL